MLRYVLVSFALLCALPTWAGDPGLNGAWIVDLSTKPEEPYSKPMHLSLLADGRVEGEFYNSTIEAGRWKEDRGRTCASFRTSDGAGPYHTSVCLTGATASGQTWAEHRNFLFNWKATRAAVTGIQKQ